jgi:peptidyl-tRNA hydrolase, PTH1 family
MRKRKLFRFIKLRKTSAKDLTADYYIFGLGNIGEKYVGTRHNVGFDVVDTIASDFGVSFDAFLNKSVCAKITVKGKDILLVKPQTYMNHSGQCVKAFMRKRRIDIDNIVVVYDDIDLKKSAIRIKKGGSAGTHNGLRSIIYHLNRDDFKRVRVGIGRPQNKDDLIPYVLGKYDKSDYDLMYDCYKKAAKASVAIFIDGIHTVQSQYNSKGEK